MLQVFLQDVLPGLAAVVKTAEVDPGFVAAPLGDDHGVSRCPAGLVQQGRGARPQAAAGSGAARGRRVIEWRHRTTVRNCATSCSECGTNARARLHGPGVFASCRGGRGAPPAGNGFPVLAPLRPVGADDGDGIRDDGVEGAGDGMGGDVALGRPRRRRMSMVRPRCCSVHVPWHFDGAAAGQVEVDSVRLPSCRQIDDASGPTSSAPCCRPLASLRSRRSCR